MDLHLLCVVHVAVLKHVLHTQSKVFTVISYIDRLVFPISDCPTLVVWYVFASFQCKSGIWLGFILVLLFFQIQSNLAIDQYIYQWVRYI